MSAKQRKTKQNKNIKKKNLRTLLNSVATSALKIRTFCGLHFTRKSKDTSAAVKIIKKKNGKKIIKRACPAPIIFNKFNDLNREF